MNLFPERTYRSGRRFLVFALVVSLFIHLAGGSIWALFQRLTVAAAPASGPTSDVAAVSDAITIERRNATRDEAIARAPKAVVRKAATAPPARTAVRKAARPRKAVATPPPVPRKVERAAAVPRIVAMRVPRAVPMPTEPPQRKPAAASAASALSAERMAALDAQFRGTIAAAQRAVAQGPPQQASSTFARQVDRQAAADERRNYQIMGGSPEEFRTMHLITGGGDCVPLQGPFPAGRMKGYYIKCMVRYSDAFSEEVSFPWPFYFPRGKDPFDWHDNANGTMSFPGQDPPADFVLPPNFALSRTVCAYYKGRCGAILDAEKKRGDFIKPP